MTFCYLIGLGSAGGGSESTFRPRAGEIPLSGVGFWVGVNMILKKRARNLQVTAEDEDVEEAEEEGEEEDG